jgi:hypothetical protein
MFVWKIKIEKKRMLKRKAFSSTAAGIVAVDGHTPQASLFGRGRGIFFRRAAAAQNGHF